MTRQRTIYVSGADPSRDAHARPTNPGFERFMWYFMRLSGLALVILAMGHMIIMHVLVQLSGQEVNFAFVTSRWGTPFWRIYDFLLLVLALIHGVNGTRIVLGDFVRRGGLRTTLLVGLAAVTVVWMVLGMVVIIGFDPATAGASSVSPFAK
ncbi:MAG TPA: succinate dehydrogenase [Candidatus Limnocylindria bacterium]|nr:succinate dehydrogenase [Candidatus Limnocylindria bacterium]